MILKARIEFLSKAAATGGHKQLCLVNTEKTPLYSKAI